MNRTIYADLVCYYDDKCVVCKNQAIREESHEEHRLREMDWLGYTSRYTFEDMWNNDDFVIHYHTSEDDENDHPTKVSNIRKEYR